MIFTSTNAGMLGFEVSEQFDTMMECEAERVEYGLWDGECMYIDVTEEM